MIRRLFAMLGLGVILVIVAACGTVATPEWEVADEPNLLEALDDTDAHGEEEAVIETEAPTVAPTEVPPTVAPTEEPTLVPTEVPPTATPTEEVVEEVDSAALIADAIAAGDVENGQAVFVASYETASGVWMCSTCHSVDESEVRLVGPGLYNLFAHAEDRIVESGDEDVVAYVRNSILMPAAYHVPADPAYPENMMPQNYGDVLTEQELTDVVAYLLTLGNE